MSADKNNDQLENDGAENFNWDDETPASNFLTGADEAKAKQQVAVKSSKNPSAQAIAEEDDDLEEQEDEDDDNQDDDDNDGEESTEEEDDNETDDDDDENQDDDEDEDKKDKKKPVKKQPVKDAAKTGKDKDDEEKDEKTVTANPEFYAVLLDELKDEGVLEFAEIPKGKKKLTKQEALQVLDTEVDGRLENELKNLFAAVREDEVGSDFMKFIKNGGNPADFVRVFAEETIPEGLDTTKEDVAFAVIRHFYQTVEEATEEEIQDTIERLKETEAVEKTATKLYKQLLKRDARLKAELIQGQQQEAEKNKKKALKFASELIETAKSGDVFGLPISQKDQRKLIDNITKGIPQGKKIRSKFQQQLDEAVNDPKTMLALSWMLENKFDFSKLEAIGETKLAKKTKRSLENLNKGGKDLKGKSKATGRALADYFDE